jgi:hypothetical protein
VGETKAWPKRPGQLMRLPRVAALNGCRGRVSLADCNNGKKLSKTEVAQLIGRAKMKS